MGSLQGDAVTLSLSGLPEGDHWTFDASTGLLRGTPNNDDAQAIQPCELALLGHILNAELHGFHNEEFLTIQPVAPVVEEAT